MLAVIAAAVAMAASPSSTGCPTRAVAMAKFFYRGVEVVACEDLRPNGTITVLRASDHSGGGGRGGPGFETARLQKRVFLTGDGVPDGRYYLNWTVAQVLAAPTDVLGNWLLGIHGNPPRSEPSWTEVASIIPPIRKIGAARVWVANRESGRDITVDENGYNHLNGLPNPAQAAKFLPGFGHNLSLGAFTAEGTVVGQPSVILGFPPAAGFDSWEMSLVPVPNGTGFEQPVQVRFVAVNSSAPNTPHTLYFDSMGYMPSECGPGTPEGDVLAGCAAPGNYYAALLDNHFFWEATWASEGRMVLDLPNLGGTDGGLLAEQSQHAIILDMITRSGGVWPRYGTMPGYDQPDDGQEEILTATVMMALEWGLFDYAKATLDNYLTFFVRDDGSILYRGLEMAQQGRILTCIGLYYRYTADASLLLEHVVRIDGLAHLLRERRAMSLRFPAGDPRHGMASGIDETDMWWASMASNGTELPFISITSEMWRGFVEAGSALADIAAAEAPVLPPATVARLNRVSAGMLSVAPTVLADFRASMASSATATNVTGGPRCFPYVAGTGQCGELNASVGCPTSRASEPWRTYAETFYSGALDPAMIAEILAWHQTQQGAGVSGSRLKLGVLSGAGNNIASGDSLETFTLHGYGYGLLTADLIEPFLLQFFAVSAHGYSRGTWIAPESTSVDRNAYPLSFCTPAGMVAPLDLKWMLVFEQPITHVLWVGKATPRAWLGPGGTVGITNATTAYGRLSFRYTSALSSSGEGVITASVDWLPRPRGPGPGAIPAGGLKLRFRSPVGAAMRKVELADGKPWLGLNATEETVVFTAADLKTPGVIASLSHVKVTFGKPA